MASALDFVDATGCLLTGGLGGDSPVSGDRDAPGVTAGDHVDGEVGRPVQEGVDGFVADGELASWAMGWRSSSGSGAAMGDDPLPVFGAPDPTA
jgi:hypothetical protein